MDEENDLLSEEEIKFIRESQAGRKLISELKEILAKTRLEVDDVKPDRLPVLQGRISTFKEILLLLGE